MLIASVWAVRIPRDASENSRLSLYHPSHIFPPYKLSLPLMPEDPQPSSLSAAEQFLESLGDITSAPVAVEPADPSSASQPADAKEILSFLDEITNTATSTTVEEEAAVSSSSSPPPPLEPAITTAAAATAAATATAGAWVSWGNSLWSQASQAVKTTTEQIAKTAADPETARRLEERVKGLGNLVNTDNINKISELYILLEFNLPRKPNKC